MISHRIKPLKTWNDFLAFTTLPHNTLLEQLKFSVAALTDPGSQRALVWNALIDPNYKASIINFYRNAKLLEKAVLPSSSVNQIKEDVLKAFSGVLSHLQTPSKLVKMTTILALFSLKRPDIGYQTGMNFIAAVLTLVFETEGEAFVAFCHIIEKIFPNEYFSRENRKIKLYKELRIFALMAESIRPNILKVLKARFREKAHKTIIEDSFPFVETMKRIQHYWLSTLFATALNFEEVLRAWDMILIFGIEFAHKLGLALLGKNENFFVAKVQKELKSLKLGRSVDALIIAGNLARILLQKTVTEVSMSEIIKKIFWIDKYRNIRRVDFIEQAEEFESNFEERTGKLRQAKEMIVSSGLVKQAFNILDLLDESGLAYVKRFEFAEIWKTEKEVAHHIFSIFDQHGQEMLKKNVIKSGISCLIGQNLEEKIDLCLHSAFKSEIESTDNIIELLADLEFSLDARSAYFDSYIEEFYVFLPKDIDNKVRIDHIKNVVKSHQSCKRIYEILNRIENVYQEKIEHTPTSIPLLERSYIETNSPITLSINTSTISDIELNNEEICEVIVEKVHEVKKNGMNIEMSMENFLADAIANTEELVHIDKASQFWSQDLSELTHAEFVKGISEQNIKVDLSNESCLQNSSTFNFSDQSISHSESQTLKDLLSFPSKSKNARLCTRECNII